MTHRSIVVPVLLALAGSLGHPAEVRAAEPITAEQFDIQYMIPDPDGGPARVMSAVDRELFVNRARCECGQPLRAKISMRSSPETDHTRLIETFVGPYCASAESNPNGQFDRCGKLKSGTAPVYFQGVEADFHPLFLASGVELSSGEVRYGPDAVLTGTCDVGLGKSGVWMCAQTNATSGCQSDEFFLQPDGSSAPGTLPSITHDFSPPNTLPTQFAPVVADGGIALRWETTPGANTGFRVLCERADDGTPAPNQSFEPPDPLAAADGKHFYNAHNLCGGEPWLTYKTAAKPAGDGSCGDGVKDEGEACDDGEDNDANGLCRDDCSLGVSADLHALDWAYLCSDHLDWSERSVNIHGLENGVQYNFVLVSYDTAGNPRAMPLVARAAPDAAFDPLPGAPAQDDGCGCTSDPSPGWAGLALLLGLALRRRRSRGCPAADRAAAGVKQASGSSSAAS